MITKEARATAVAGAPATARCVLSGERAVAAVEGGEARARLCGRGAGGRRRGALQRRRMGARAGEAASRRRRRVLLRASVLSEIGEEGRKARRLSTWGGASVPVVANNRDECPICPGCWQ